jgi:hypothetical protein
MKIVTRTEIEYRAAGTLARHIIPAGTQCVVADNLPGDGQYWACEWDGMDLLAESWQRNYGFLLDENDVEHISASFDFDYFTWLENRAERDGEANSMLRAALANRQEAK